MMNKRLNKFGEELGRFLDFYNISINSFADRIGTTPKNLIDIIEGRVSLSFNMICNIAFISEISVDYICNVEEAFKIDNYIDEYIKEHNITLKNYLNRFNYKELKDMYNVRYRDIRNDYSILEDIFRYLRIVNPKLLYKEDNHIFYKSRNDKPELLALWLERCYRVVREQEINEYKKENIEKLVSFIKEEASKNIFNKEKLIKVFNENGIFLAIEPDLKGAKIRGAFRVLNNKPAIYITTKYKRCGDIYFALLHELAHCKSDFNRARKASLVSFEKDNEGDFELRADKTAFNWMINDKEYENIIKTKNYDNLNCLVVYRIAHDKKINYNSEIYQKYNPVICE